MPTQAKFRDLTPDETQFVSSASLVGENICHHYLPARSPQMPDALDDAYEAWATDTNPKKPAPKEVCFGLGALLGNCVVTDLGFSWKMATDRWGTDYCVRHPDSWCSYPFDFVIKRIDDQELQGGFFRALYNLLQKREPI